MCVCDILFSLTSQAYTSNDLSGLTVEHSTEAFREGRDIVLTLKDKGQSKVALFCNSVEWYRLTTFVGW